MGRRLTGGRQFDEGQVGRQFVDPNLIPLGQGGRELLAREGIGAGMELLVGPEQFAVPEQIQQPLPIDEGFVGPNLPQGQRFFITEEPGQAPKLSNVPTGSPYERELQLPEQRQVDVGGRQLTISGDRPLDEGGLRALEGALTPPLEEEVGAPEGTALEQAQDLFNQMQAAGVAIEFPAAMAATGLDQQIKLEERIRKDSPEVAGISEVQSSKILSGGLTQITRKDGTVELKSLDEAQRELVKQAEKRSAELQGLRTSERENAKAAIKTSIESFKGMTSIKKNIVNLDEAITLIDEGAQTGVIAARFPSIKAASIKLQNIQDKLGLDVIGMTTFGALSESELNFALRTALPTTLEGPELRQWLLDKKEAQSKVIANLEEAAIFLGTDGNSIAEFLKFKKGQSVSAEDADDLTPAEQAELAELRRRFK